MTELLVKILPLQLASTLSPGIFALAIILLAHKVNTLSRTLAMLLGSSVVVVILSIIGLKVGQNISPHDQPTLISTIIDLAIAAFFLYFGLKSLFVADKEKHRKIAENESPHFFKWFAIGFLISITNFDAVLLNMAAAKEIGASDVITFDKIILILVGAFLFISPISIPLLFYVILPNLAEKLLTPVNKFLLKYGRFIIAIVFLLFALYLIIKALKFF